MRVGFIGDIVGKPGRQIIQNNLKRLRSEYGLDLVIANCENASHGFGLTVKNAQELLSYGIDFFTGGNHSFDKKDIIAHMDHLPITRPLNYPEGSAGVGYKVVNVADKKLAVINLMGHFAMPMADNPFTTIMQQIEAIKAQSDHLLIDFHAEATAEKQALFHMLYSEVDAIMGTHTHVGTDDLTVQQGTCFVSDVGLTGSIDGVIGMDKDIVLRRMLQGYSEHFDIPKQGRSILQMVVMEFENRCKSAQKIRLYSGGDIKVDEARYD